MPLFDIVSARAVLRALWRLLYGRRGDNRGPGVQHTAGWYFLRRWGRTTARAMLVVEEPGLEFDHKAIGTELRHIRELKGMFARRCLPNVTHGVLYFTPTRAAGIGMQHSSADTSRLCTMTDLAERFARTQGWIHLYRRARGGRGPSGTWPRGAPALWADCEPGGGGRWRLALSLRGRIPVPRQQPPIPLRVFCEAYCKAVECIDGDSE